MEPTPKKRGGNPNMVKGGPSVNPRGRPRVGEALSEAARARCTPEALVEFWVSVMNSPHQRMADRMSAAAQIADRAFGRPVQTTEIDATINTTDIVPADYTRMTPSERAAWLATLDVPTGGKA